MSIFKENVVESMKEREKVTIKIIRPNGAIIEAEGYVTDISSAIGNPEYIESIAFTLHGPQGELTIKE